MRMVARYVRVGAAVMVASAVLLSIPSDRTVDDARALLPGCEAPLPEERVEEKAPGQARADCYGDPLPHAALARLGTVRLAHNSAVFDLAFSPDGKVIASSCGDGCIHLWAVASGKETGRLGQPGRVDRWGLDGRFIRFMPDGKTIITTDDRHSCTELWSVAAQTRRRPAKDELVLSAAPSPDGKTVAEITRAGFVRLWELATGKELRRFSHQQDPVAAATFALVFSPDGRY